MGGKRMKGRLSVYAALLCVAITGCAPQGARSQGKTGVPESVNEEVTDTIIGKMEKHSYSGLFPVAAGEHIHYTLTIQNQKYSGDGVFKLIKNCLNAENKTYKSEEYHGRRYTQRGIPGDNDATVWQLKADDRTIFNFLYNSSDNTLTLLNNNFEIAGGASDYTLKPEE